MARVTRPCLVITSLCVTLIITSVALLNVLRSNPPLKPHTNTNQILGLYNAHRASLGLPLFPSVAAPSTSSLFVPLSIISAVIDEPHTIKYELKRKRRRRALSETNSLQPIHTLTFVPDVFGEHTLHIPAIIHAYKLIARDMGPDHPTRVTGHGSRAARRPNGTARSRRVTQGRGKANRMLGT